MYKTARPISWTWAQIMTKILLISLLGKIYGQYFGDYRLRLEKWNTGRLYFAEDNGFFLGKYGPVCTGWVPALNDSIIISVPRTRDEQIAGENGAIFAKAICYELGFGKDAARFYGNHAAYYQFMGLTEKDDGEVCVPEFVIAGANCNCNNYQSAGRVCSLRQHCRIRNYRVDGGSCMKGESDIFIHCEAPQSPIRSTWSSWNEIGDCRMTDYFQQKVRECTGTNTFCPGPWLEVHLNCDILLLLVFFVPFLYFFLCFFFTFFEIFSEFFDL